RGGGGYNEARRGWIRPPLDRTGLAEAATMSDTRIQRPGLYYPKMRATWWLSRPGYVRFMIREATSVFIAIFLVEFLMLVRAIGQGPQAYAAMMACLASPGAIAFN